MRPNKSSKAIPDTNPGTRRAWEPPAITKLAIGTETKSARESGRSDRPTEVCAPGAAGNTRYEAWIFLRDGVSAIRPHRQLD